MKPLHTTYRFAKEGDREGIDRLWATTDIPKFPTSFPEIVAERDGQIIGFVARRHDEQGIIIEPMISPNAVVYLRLWHALEAILERSGVKRYFFRIEPHRIVYEKALKRREQRGWVQHRGYHGGYDWYERVIP